MQLLFALVPPGKAGEKPHGRNGGTAACREPDLRVAGYSWHARKAGSHGNVFGANQVVQLGEDSFCGFLKKRREGIPR